MNTRACIRIAVKKYDLFARRRIGRPVVVAVHQQQRGFVVTASSASQRRIIDLRSDTVTAPSRQMLETALTAPTGDDVFSEDPTVLDLEAYTADLFGKEKGLYLPSSTMANLVAILAHCHGRASEIIIGATSHISLWEGGNAASLGGVHTRQLVEDWDTAQLSPEKICEAYRDDDDDHFAKTELLCIENSHNMMGGVAFPPSYTSEMGSLAQQLGIKLHVDGARIFNALAAAQQHTATTPKEMCEGADSVAVCLSKGLGAPIGSILVGATEVIRLAKRARKRCGGGMRQAGVVAAMGRYALEHNVERLHEDHGNAQRLADKLREHGFRLLRDRIDTNIIYFSLPKNAAVSIAEFCNRLETESGIKVGSGYSLRGGKLLRAVTHLDIRRDDIDFAADAMIKLCHSG